MSSREKASVRIPLRQGKGDGTVCGRKGQADGTQTGLKDAVEVLKPSMILAQH
jgi:hypothetical protein